MAHRKKSWWWRSGICAGLFLARPDSVSAQLPLQSPFHPRQETAAAAVADLPFEYHGYMYTAEGFQFWVADPVRHKGAFVRLNVPDSELGLVAKSYDPERSTLTVERQGRIFTLPERKAKVRSSGALPPPRSSLPRAAAAGPARTADTGVANPTPAQEQARLEAITAEINRRRAQRAQTTPDGAASTRP